MRTLRSMVLLLPLLHAGSLLAQPATQPPRTVVPVSTVMLFSSGVGYFEHAGTVQGDGSTELRFRTAQINDILTGLQKPGGFGYSNGTALSIPSAAKTGTTQNNQAAEIKQGVIDTRVGLIPGHVVRIDPSTPFCSRW